MSEVCLQQVDILDNSGEKVLPVAGSNDYFVRRNASLECLGRIRRRKCGPLITYWSPDFYIYICPTLLTSFLAAGTFFILWEELEKEEITYGFVVLFCSFLFSFLLTCTDPGVYPRLKEGEKDPLSQQTSLPYCRICAFRRPHKTSHCYVCNACVLEHDHHCNILGGCVGLRSMRWFLLYLVFTSFALAIGVFWFVRSLIRSTTSHSEWVSTRKNTLLDRAVDIRHTERPEVVDARSIACLLMLIVLFCLLLVVGAMALLYLYLVITATTRRESQGKYQQAPIVVTKKWRPFLNLYRVFFPPSSMLVEGPKHLETLI